MMMPGLDYHQAFAPLRPPAREKNPQQPISKTEARATSSAALKYRNLVTQRDRFQEQRRAGSGFTSGHRETARWSVSPCRQTIDKRSKAPMNSRGSSFEKGQLYARGFTETCPLTRALDGPELLEKRTGFDELDLGKPPRC
jgi:hypothetical protein